VAEQDNDHLDELWDSLVTGKGPYPIDVDLGVADAVRQFHTAPDVPGPDAQFVAEVLEGLINSKTNEVPQLPGHRFTPNGSRDASLSLRSVPAPPEMPRIRRRALSQMALVAVLVLAVAGSALMIREKLGTDRPLNGTFITAQSGITVTQLATVRSRVMPQATTYTGIWRATFQPGEQMDIGAVGLGLDGPSLVYVMRGSLTVQSVRSSDPVMVIRGASRVAKPEAVDSDADFTLAEGDSIGLPGKTIASLMNGSEEDVQFLYINLQTFQTAQGNETGGTWAQFVGEVRNTPMTAGPAVVTVSRVNVPAGGQFSRAEMPGLELLAVETGQISLRFGGDGASGTPLVRRAGEGFAYGQSNSSSGWVDTIANESNAPVTLLVMTVVSAGS
jgi:hypothetical protein